MGTFKKMISEGCIVLGASFIIFNIGMVLLILLIRIFGFWFHFIR